METTSFLELQFRSIGVQLEEWQEEMEMQKMTGLLIHNEEQNKVILAWNLKGYDYNAKAVQTMCDLVISLNFSPDTDCSEWGLCGLPHPSREIL